MAKLFPFRAYRYDPQRIGQVGDVVSQPYDKISPEMLETYLQRHPKNIVRVIKNPNYEEAGRYLREWIQEGTLKQDEVPAFYSYEQVFEFEGRPLTRTGFIALLSLQDADLSVKGHENVLQGPLEDRLRLIRSTESNEGLVFMLYSDPGLLAERVLDVVKAATEPDVDVTDEYGVRHRLWPLIDQPAQDHIRATVSGLPLYIADGHHRFLTSQAFYQECLEKGWRPRAVESFDKRMIALFNMENPGLRILPTHRAIRNLPHFQFDRFLAGLERHFEVETVEGLQGLQECLVRPGTRVALVANVPRRGYCLRLRDQVLEDPEFMPGLAGPSRTLDVNLLHEGILKPLLGIGAEELAAEKYVDYHRSSEELFRRVQEGEYQLGFLIRPTSLDQVRLVSEKGEKMPQKSTDFYPKLLTGLVLMKMEIDREAVETQIREFSKV